MTNTNTNDNYYQDPRETDNLERACQNAKAYISPHPPEMEELLKADKANKAALKADKLLPTITAGKLIEANIPPAEPLLSPWLKRGTIALLVAKAGIGKTWAALTIAQALATGSTAFGRWNASQPRRVLYLDGEMSLEAMQERLQKLKATGDNIDNIILYNPDLDRDSPSINIANAEAQQRILYTIKECNIDCVIIDNVASLYRTGADSNSAESWAVMQEFLLKLRREKLGAVVVDHLPKSEGANSARGTSAKNDVIDFGLILERPDGYQQEDGAVFVVEFTKTRGLYGADVTPFVATLINGQWQCADYTPPPRNPAGRKRNDANYNKVIATFEAGTTDPKEISQKTGVKLRSVYNYLNDYGWADADGYHGYSADDSNDYQ